MRTSVTLSRDDVDFLEKHRLSASTLAKLAILDAIAKHKRGEDVRLPRRENLDEELTRVSIEILPEHKMAVEALGLNLSALLREKIREIRSQLE